MRRKIVAENCMTGVDSRVDLKDSGRDVVFSAVDVLRDNKGGRYRYLYIRDNSGPVTDTHESILALSGGRQAAPGSRTGSR
jgi:hypothetical protein